MYVLIEAIKSPYTFSLDDIIQNVKMARSCNLHYPPCMPSSKTHSNLSVSLLNIFTYNEIVCFLVYWSSQIFNVSLNVVFKYFNITFKVYNSILLYWLIIITFRYLWAFRHSLIVFIKYSNTFLAEYYGITSSSFFKYFGNFKTNV